MNYSEVSPDELFRGCVTAGDAQAWEEFVRRFRDVIARTAFRVARQYGRGSAEVVEDLVQDTFLKICGDGSRLLREFEPRHKGSPFKYLQVITEHLATDHFRRENAEKRGAGAATFALDGEESSQQVATQSDGPGAIERRITLAEIDAHLRAIIAGPDAKRDHSIFILYFRQGLTAKAIASLPGIRLTTKGVETKILRITRELRARMNAPPSGGKVPDGGILRSESF